MGNSENPSWDTLAAPLALEMGTAEALLIQVLPTNCIAEVGLPLPASLESTQWALGNLPGSGLLSGGPCAHAAGHESPCFRGKKMVCLGQPCQSGLLVTSMEHRDSLT